MNAPLSLPTKQTAVPELPIWKLNVDQCHAMMRAGILIDGDPIELLDGWLVPQTTIPPPHSDVSEELAILLRQMVPAAYRVRHEQPVTLVEDSEPEPGVVVAKGTRGDFQTRHPGPQEIMLVAEVADASLGRDRGVKSGSTPGIALSPTGS